MNTSTFQNIVEDQMDSIKSVLMQGAKEYANVDRLANFKGVAEKLKISPEKVALVYLLKHIDGICKYVETGEAQRDTLDGRITDAINYLILLRAICEERKPFSLNNLSNEKILVNRHDGIAERSNSPAPKGLGGI